MQVSTIGKLRFLLFPSEESGNRGYLGFGERDEKVEWGRCFIARQLHSLMFFESV
jgi:hypothetical protein